MAATPVALLDGAARRFPGDPPVDALRPTDLRIDAGDLVAVTGRSGSGKSTLLSLLGLLDVPTGGRIELGGVDVTGMDDPQRTAWRARKVGIVFQAFHLLSHRTAVENVALALLYHGVRRAERHHRALEALRQVGLGHRLGALPGTLSGGERQRVAIARAIVAQPALLLADEPTGNLDSAMSDVVLTTFEQLHHDGMTVVVATHDPCVAARCSRRLVLDDGLLREER